VSEQKLSVYANSVTDWIVAYSPEDAVEVAKIENRKAGISDEEADYEFERVPDSTVLRMATGDYVPVRKVDPLAVPDSDDLFEKPVHTTRATVEVVEKKTAAEWAASRGRGFLMSTEY
jgi:hypothetical protein